MHVVIYEDGLLTLSNKPHYLQKPILIDFEECKEGSTPWWFSHYENHILEVSIVNAIKVRSLNAYFSGCENLRIVNGLENLDIKNCKDFRWMFEDCFHLTTISGMDKWDVTKSIENNAFNNIFSENTSLEKIYLPNTWPILNIKQFTNCARLKEIHYKNKIYSYNDLLEYKKFH